MNEEAATALAAAPTDPTPEKPLRHVRYRGKNPRHFREKYKEFQPDRYSDDVAGVDLLLAFSPNERGRRGRKQ